MKKELLILPALLILIGIGPQAANATIVTNGGFETGDLTGWTVTGADLGITAEGSPNSGTYHFLGYDNSGFATLAQTLTTTVGTTYDFSFFSNTNFDVSGNILRYQIASAPIVTVTRTTAWAQTSTSFVASGTATALNFYYETDGSTGIWCIDDVLVDPIPEPSTLAIWSLLALCGIGIGWYRRRKA